MFHQIAGWCCNMFKRGNLIWWHLKGWLDRKRLGWLGQLHCFSFACLRKRAGCTGTHRVPYQLRCVESKLLTWHYSLLVIGAFGLLGPVGPVLQRRPVLFQAPPICWAQARSHLHVGTLAELKDLDLRTQYTFEIIWVQICKWTVVAV